MGVNVSCQLWNEDGQYSGLIFVWSVCREGFVNFCGRNRDWILTYCASVDDKFHLKKGGKARKKWYILRMNWGYIYRNIKNNTYVYFEWYMRIWKDVLPMFNVRQLLIFEYTHLLEQLVISLSRRKLRHNCICSTPTYTTCGLYCKYVEQTLVIWECIIWYDH